MPVGLFIVSSHQAEDPVSMITAKEQSFIISVKEDEKIIKRIAIKCTSHATFVLEKLFLEYLPCTNILLIQLLVSRTM